MTGRLSSFPRIRPELRRPPSRGPHPPADLEERAGESPGKADFLGAFHDLERVVATHLFVICATNSGTTFLRKALATSRRTWNLPWEGRKAGGYVGPLPANDPELADGDRIWAARRRWLDVLEDPAKYDWPHTRKAWYFQAHARDPAASVFVQKTPEHLLVVDALARHFRNARFLFMVRNPYAVCEGICRTLRHRHTSGRGAPRKAASEGVRLEILAARHVATCLEYQRRNVDAFGERGRFFTYEAMCAEPERTARTIRELAPALDDLNLRQRLPVHRKYHEMLTDMNARQIARLTPGQIAAINRVFRRHRAILDHFGYDIMDRPP